jgi:hypothetical protein
VTWASDAYYFSPRNKESRASATTGENPAIKKDSGASLQQS